MRTEASVHLLSWIPKTKKKQPWEKSNYCRWGLGVGDLEVWSRIMNDPRRMNSRRCADSLRDNRLGHDGCWRPTLWLLQGPNLWDSSMPPGLIRITSKGSFSRTHLGLHRKPLSTDTSHNSISYYWPDWNCCSSFLRASSNSRVWKYLW